MFEELGHMCSYMQQSKAMFDNLKWITRSQRYNSMLNQPLIDVDLVLGFGEVFPGASSCCASPITLHKIYWFWPKTSSTKIRVVRLVLRPFQINLQPRSRYPGMSVSQRRHSMVTYFDCNISLAVSCPWNVSLEDWRSMSHRFSKRHDKYFCHLSLSVRSI